MRLLIGKHKHGEERKNPTQRLTRILITRPVCSLGPFTKLMTKKRTESMTMSTPGLTRDGKLNGTF